MNETTPPGPFSAAYWENRATKLAAQLEAMTEENVRLRESLRHYAEGYPGGIGETAREALGGGA